MAEVLALLESIAAPDSLRFRFDESRLGELTGRLHPDAPPQGLRLSLLNSALFFLHDDWVAEQHTDGQLRGAAELAAAYDRALAAFDGAPAAPDDIPLVRITALIGRELGRFRLPQHAERYRAALGDYLHAHLWEVDVQRQGTTPSLTEYRQLRPLVMGVRPLIELLPPIHGRPVPAHLLDHPAVQALRGILVNVHYLVNDLYSLVKEMHAERPVNVVLVMCAEHDLTLQQGVDATAELIPRETTAYVRLKASLPRLGLAHPALLTHLTDLEHLVADSVAWHTAAPRYYQSVPSPGMSGT